MVEFGTGLIAVGFFILFGFIYWVDYKKSLHTKNKTNPILKALILSFLMIAFLFLAESLGYFPKNWNSEHFYYHLSFVLIMLVLFMWLAKRKTPKSYEEQKTKILIILKDEFKGELYTGNANIDWLLAYKHTINSGNNEDTNGEIGNFFIRCVKGGKTTFTCWIQINVFTLQLLYIQPHPQYEQVQKYLSEFSPTKDNFNKEFEEEEKVSKIGSA